MTITFDNSIISKHCISEWQATEFDQANKLKT